ncbi:DUF4352 domain-containing protein [Actinoplanes subglobosus]|uniref:DUF4352 domain-containing protein n=1 Tax=Actinoplanes subglobosus TaxID=1547892 RepID=A0ABV8J1V6_9ACTN
MSHDFRHQRRPVRKARSVSPVKVTVAVVVSVLAVIALFAAGIAAEQFSHGSPAATTPATPKGKAAAAPPTGKTAAAPPAQAVADGPRPGDAVRDGKFEFVVSRVDCSRSSLGIEHLKRSADGKFCVVSLTVRNIGDTSKFFVGPAQKAHDASGTAYSSDELAGIIANRGTEAFLEQLGPGEKVTGKLVFDVPKKTTLTVLELHDSPLSGGVEATLAGL